MDAFRIADFLRIGRYNKFLIKEEKYVALQRLTRSRYQLVHQQTECKQHFLKNLYYKCNTLSKELNTSVFGATMMEILSDSLSLDVIAEMDLEALATLLQKKGKGRFSDPEDLAKTIKKAIRDSYRLGKVVQDSVDVVLATYARLIQTLKKTNQRDRKKHYCFILSHSRSEIFNKCSRHWSRIHRGNHCGSGTN
ncbi:IS110 family transposase [Bacillus thuringiensis]|uniref:IS110 family transposase n=1 Tax=Bacillus thuringiensis TaxID=1428 RepID=UPI001E61F4AD|nr:IS110 family transposase [Bacillus thuringiensis]